MYQVEVEVVQLQCSKAPFAPFLYHGLLMKCVPQLWEETKLSCDSAAPIVQTRDKDANISIVNVGQIYHR